MKSTDKIAIIGGTGKSGKYLVKSLINKGMQFKLLIRNPENISFEYSGMEVITGDVTDQKAVAQLLEGTSAVISTLGMGIPASSPDLFAKATELILQTMSEYQIRRYVVVTGLNVDAVGDSKSEKTRMSTEWMKTNFPVSTTSKQEEYKMLVNSSIDWTLVRLPMIEQTDEIRTYQVDLSDCKGDKISASSLAAFLIEQLHSDKFHRLAPFIYDL
ncbi:NAD(P)-dependent oxidoreductase [Algoriphagus sp. A40]|uniref:NAD(P)-dependent oxidoreductase n=1 Tax=Algoriphagus sp. A40 TaxID=1945863 RepID=UPI0009852A3C|nr:NAD(P)H-binding protein [Algoriphagus sp. A40]OOG75345.1 hypothetical protein B0E43_10210 [Algoriphagus sp. A40]